MSGGSVSELLKTTDPAPPGGTFRQFFSVRLNDIGQVLFTSGFDREDPVYLYVLANNEVSAIAQSGMAAPGGGAFYNVTSASINNNGDVAFAAQLTSGAFSGIFRWSRGVTTRVIDATDPALNLSIPSSMNGASINDAGQIALSVTGPGSSAIYLWDGGSISGLVHQGDALDVGPASVLFGTLLNAFGEVAFTAAGSSSPTGVYLASLSGIRRIAGFGDAISATPRFTSATTAGVSSRGDGAFLGTTSPGGLAVFDPTGVMRLRPRSEEPFSFNLVQRVAVGGGGRLAAVVALARGGRAVSIADGSGSADLVRTGDAAPEGGTFTDIASVLAMNASGHVAFVGRANGKWAIYVARHGSIAVIVREGDIAPTGAEFRRFLEIRAE